MPSLKGISGEKAIHTFEKLGFISVRQRGSHVILKREKDGITTGCVIPLHHELAEGTLRGIFKASTGND